MELDDHHFAAPKERMNFDINNEKTLTSGKEPVGSELLPEHGSTYAVGLPEQRSRPGKLLEPTTNLQEIQRTEELIKCHQGNAISKVQTVGSLRDQMTQFLQQQIAR